MIFEYKGEKYPEYIKHGNAIKYVIPFAKEFIKGDKILDIGGTKEWHYPGSKIINITEPDKYSAYMLPDGEHDSIISSHCLEHLEYPKEALRTWYKHLKKDGCLFLYLPHIKMRYWANDCDKHKQYFTPDIIKYWLEDIGFKDIITSGRDLYYSFSVVGWKK